MISLFFKTIPQAQDFDFKTLCASSHPVTFPTIQLTHTGDDNISSILTQLSSLTPSTTF